MGGGGVRSGGGIPLGGGVGVRGPGSYIYIYISIDSDCNSGFPTNPPGIFAEAGSQDAFPRALIHFLAVSQEASPSEAIEEAIRGRKP